MCASRFVLCTRVKLFVVYHWYWLIVSYYCWFIVSLCFVKVLIGCNCSLIIILSCVSLFMSLFVMHQRRPLYCMSLVISIIKVFLLVNYQSSLYKILARVSLFVSILRSLLVSLFILYRSKILHFIPV